MRRYIFLGLARQCLAFFICQVKRTHILQVGPRKALAKLSGQHLCQRFQRLLPVVSAFRFGLLIFGDNAPDIPVGAQKLAVDLPGNIAAGGFQNDLYLRDNASQRGRYAVLIALHLSCLRSIDCIKNYIFNLPHQR